MIRFKPKLLYATLCVILFAGNAYAQLRRPAQPADHAATFAIALDAGSLQQQLLLLAAQTQSSILYDPQIQPASELAPALAALTGRYTLAQALDRVLTGRALSWQKLASGMIRIQARTPELRLRLGTLTVRAPAPETANPARAVARIEPTALLSEQTSAGWILSPEILQSLPNNSTLALMGRAPNTYGEGGRISLRGVERDSFSAQTLTVAIDGIPLSAAMLESNFSLPTAIAELDIRLGPQPQRADRPNFAGEIALLTPAPDPQSRGASRVQLGPGGARSVEAQQSGFSQHLGSASIAFNTRRTPTRSLGSAEPVQQSLGFLRWYLEPEARPELTVSVSAFSFAADASDRRILVPLNFSDALRPFDPFEDHDLAVPNQRRLHDKGLGAQANWQAERWRLSTQHTFMESELVDTGRALAGQRERRSQAEAWQQHGLTIERNFSNISFRTSFDYAKRKNSFLTGDQLALSELFPSAGGNQVTPGAIRELTTGVLQNIDRYGAQFWLSHELSPALRWEFGAAGARELRVDQAVLQRRVIGENCQLQIRGAASVACALALPEINEVRTARIRDSAFTPALTLRYAPTGTRAYWGTLAAQWRKGARSGGARPFAGRVITVNPERSDTYELSWRRDWGKLSQRVAVFRNDWRDRQVQLIDPSQSGFAIVNSGQAHAYGAEWMLSRNAGDFHLGMGIGLLKTRFDRFVLPDVSGAADLSGKQFLRAPARTASLVLAYAPERGAQFGASLYAADRAMGDIRNRSAGELAGYANTDLRIGWRGPQYAVALELENAFDKRRFQQIDLSIASDAPRAYYLAERRTLNFEFEWRW